MTDKRITSDRLSDWRHWESFTAATDSWGANAFVISITNTRTGEPIGIPQSVWYSDTRAPKNEKPGFEFRKKTIDEVDHFTTIDRRFLNAPKTLTIALKGDKLISIELIYPKFIYRNPGAPFFSGNYQRLTLKSAK